MKQFFSDWIHLTEGELFLKYWWLWVLIVIGAYSYLKMRK
jgi:hypothetical protein